MRMRSEAYSSHFCMSVCLFLLLHLCCSSEKQYHLTVSGILNGFDSCIEFRLKVIVRKPFSVDLELAL